MPHNIEKLPGKTHYTGYGSGAVWHISKTNSSYGNWIARDQNAQGLQPVYAFTLKEMSHKIEDAKTRNTREPSTSYTTTGRKNPRLTLSALNKEAKPLGLIVTRSEDGEYRVAFKSNREASAYYTDDIEDAQGTMRAMAKEGDRHTVRGKKNPTRKKAVELSAMYIEGIKEARDELKMLRREFPEWTDATIFAERAAFNVKTAEKLMAQAPKGSPQYDFIAGQRDFWEGKRVLTIKGKKNPAPKFGKRKSKPAKPRKAAESVRVKFGRRKPRPVGSSVVDYVIRAISTDGKKYYWDGLLFDSDPRKAARYHDTKQAERLLEEIENRVSKKVRAVDIVAAP